VAVPDRRPAEAYRLRRLAPGDPALDEVLTLVREAFGFMDDRIDPPSSMHRLDLGALDRQAAEGEIWVAGEPVAACVFLSYQPGALYLGKLAVAGSARRQGLARRLVDLAEGVARALGLPALELQTRVELTENHATFRAMGFTEVARTAHPGYDRPTSITFRRAVPG
jgi:ribosomal protein S18 acetylase RimI-like enzyme